MSIRKNIVYVWKLTVLRSNLYSDLIMDFSKTIKKNGLFYYHRNKLLAKWAAENKAAAEAAAQSGNNPSKVFFYFQIPLIGIC